ncbi:MAG: 30S ribosomal protein S20 [Alphaproteobacteria bacterium]|nr:30S ribosomal protein S20 [Alphaproteobacteria bacterium]
MANHKSAKKRARQTVKRNETNRSRRSAIRTLSKEAETAATAGDSAASVKALRRAESALSKDAGKTLHWKTAARKTSRLAKRAKAAAKKA